MTDYQGIDPPARLYAERDIEDQGEHYVRHMNEMTREGLHSKSDIAAELAHRDIEIERLRSLIERAHTIISIREVSFRTHKGAAWLQQASRELKDRKSAPETVGFGDLPPRPSRPTKMLDIQTATTQQALEHYMLVVDYWIAEAQWQEKRGDQLNQELTAFLRTANRRAAREPANADGLIAALHLLKGHAQSPIHCETADRAIREIERLTRALADEERVCQAWAADRDRLRAMVTEWLHAFGSTDDLSIRTRALLNGQPADASASERCHFRAFGSLPCEKPKGHDGSHVCKWPETAPSVDAEDAAKWRALRNCARITTMGSAGLGDDKASEDYGHVTLNFWTGVDDVDRGPEYARDWLDRFVEKARRSKVSRPAAAGSATGSTDQPAPEASISADVTASPGRAPKISVNRTDTVDLLRRVPRAMALPPDEEGWRLMVGSICHRAAREITQYRAETEALRNHIFNGLDFMEAWLRQFGSTDQLSSETRQWCAVQIPRAAEHSATGANDV